MIRAEEGPRVDEETSATPTRPAATIFGDAIWGYSCPKPTRDISIKNFWSAKPVPASVYQPVCVFVRLISTDVASIAWTATPARGLQGARDERVAGYAQRSRRHRLPPRTDDYVPGGKRTGGSQNPGTHPRTLAQRARRLPQSTTGRGARATLASTGRTVVASTAPHDSTEQGPHRYGLPRARLRATRCSRR